MSLDIRLVSPGISLVSLETGRVSLEMRLVPLETLLIDRCLRWPRVFFPEKNFEAKASLGKQTMDLE